MTSGARGLVSDFQRADAAAAKRDPLAEQMTALTHRKTQIGYAKQAAQQLEQKFLDTEGADLFERDPTTNKPLKGPEGGYVPRMGAEIDSLRGKSSEKVGLIRGALTPGIAAGDSTDDAKAAAARLAEQEPIYKAKMDKWNRIQEQMKRIQAAHDDTEMQLGQFAAQRLERDGVDIFGTPAETPQPVQQGSSVVERQAHNPKVAGSSPAPAPTPQGNTTAPTAAGQPPVAPTVTQPGAAPAPQPAGPTPLALVQMHKRMKDNESVIAMETTNPNLKKALQDKNARMEEQFLKGLALQTPISRQRVIDITRDPTIGEKVKNFVGKIAGGIGTTVLDTAESLARNAKYVPNLALPGITVFTPDFVRKQQADGDKVVKEFANAMRDEAAGWGLKGVPAEVAQKLNDSFASSVGQGIGSTIGFIGPTSIVGGVGKMAGLTDAAITKLMTATVAATGAASESNNFRREAEMHLQPLVDSGEMTKDEMDRALGVAEVFGGAVGSTEAFTGISRMAKRIGEGKAGRSFLRTLFDVAGKKGASGAAKWLKGPGSKAAIDVASEMLEESAQEFGQNTAENLYASLTFDKGREILPGASEAAGSAAVSTLIVSSLTQALGLPGQTRRYKSLGEAVNKGAEDRRNGQNPGQNGTTAPTSPVQPTSGQSRPAETTKSNELLQKEGQGKGRQEVLNPGQEADNTPPAAPVASQDGKVVNRWTFTDKDGQEQSVDATGLKDAISKLPEGYKPDLTKAPRQETIAAPADQATTHDLSGKQIDKEWTAFSPESQSLGIPRAEMPQVKAEHRGALTQFLKAKDITSTEEEVLPGTLKPTQAEFSQAKVDKARGFTGGDRAILVSQDGHVIDGHHQWMAKLTDEPNKPMRVIRLDAPIKDLLAAVKEFPSAETAGGATAAGKPAPAEFLGIEGEGTKKAFETYRLTEDIPGHVKGSSVSRKTLEDAGFNVPARPGATGKEVTVPPVPGPNGESNSLSNELRSGVARVVYESTEGANPENAKSLEDYEMNVSLLEEKLKRGKQLTAADMLNVGDGSVANASWLNSELKKSPENLVAALREAIDRKLKPTSQPAEQKPGPNIGVSKPQATAKPAGKPITQGPESGAGNASNPRSGAETPSAPAPVVEPATEPVFAGMVAPVNSPAAKEEKSYTIPKSNGTNGALDLTNKADAWLEAHAKDLEKRMAKKGLSEKSRERIGGVVAQLRAEQERRNPAPVAAQEPTAVTETPVVAETASTEPAASFAPTVDGILSLRKRIASGEATPDEVKAAWNTLKSKKAELIKDLASRKKDDLLRFAGISSRSSDTKAQLVKSAVSSLQHLFVAGDSVGYNPMSETLEQAIDKQMDKWTPEHIANEKAKSDERAAEREKAKAAKEKALTNPETLEELERFAYAAGAKAINAEGKASVQKTRSMPRDAMNAYITQRGTQAFTPEQKAKYEALLAEKTRGQREQDEARKKTVEAVALPDGAQFSDIIETKHTQKSHDLFVVQMNQRVERAAYDALNTRAKKLGGSYSSYNRNGAIPGFQFKSREAAEQFRSGDKVEGEQRIEAKKDERLAKASVNLRELGQKQIDAGNEKMNADRKANTARRARMAASAEADAARQIRIGETMKNLADAMEANDVTFIDRITTKAHVEELESQLRQGQRLRIDSLGSLGYNDRENERQKPLSEEDAAFAKFPMPYLDKSDLMRLVAKGKNVPGAVMAAQRVDREVIQRMSQDVNGAYATSNAQAETVRELADKLKRYNSYEVPSENILAKFDSMDRLARMGIQTEAELRSALREFAQYRGKTKKADPVKVMERELIGKKIEGFFPTPATLGREVVSKADIGPGMSVLEPSAGKGDLADMVKDMVPDAKLTLIERNRTLTPLLEAKGYAPESLDFLDYPPEEKFDRIVMNPPFENGQDIAHVKHAYRMLKPGGKMVAIMSAGPFFNSNKASAEFRDWLGSVGGTSEKNPADSFNGTDAFRQTGVSTYTVEIEKAEEVKADKTPDVGEVFATDKVGDLEYEYALTKGLLDTDRSKYGIGIRRKGTDHAFESATMGYASTKEGALTRFAEKAAKAGKEYTITNEAVRKEYEAKIAQINEIKAKEEVAAEAKRSAAESEASAGKNFSDAIDAIDLPTGKKQQITTKDTKGNTVSTRDALVFGDWAIATNPSGRKPAYDVYHVPSGLRARGTDTQSAAKRLIKGFVLSGVNSGSENLRQNNEALKRMSGVVKFLEEGAAAPEWFGKPKTVSPPTTRTQSLKETRADLSGQIEDAIAKAPNVEDFMQAALEADIKSKGYRQPTNDAMRRAQDERVLNMARRLAGESTGNAVITFKSGNSTYRIANVRDALERFEKALQRNIGKPTDPTPGDHGISSAKVKEGYESAKTEAEKRGWIDQMGKDMLKSLKLDDKYEYIRPGVVMTKEAAKALADLKAGKQANFDIEASTPNKNSGIDPTAPAALAFTDATEGEYPEGLVRHVQEFAAVLNSARRRRGETNITLTPQKPGYAGENRDTRLLGGTRDDSRGAGAGTERFIRGIELALKKRIVFVKPSEAVSWEALSSPSRANTILVNTEAENPVAALVGHELGHNIKAQNPALFSQIKSIVFNLAGAPSEAYELTKREQGYSAEAVNDEWVSDMLGQRFDEPQFWRDVETEAKKQGKPNAFTELARNTWEWLTNLMRRVRSYFTRETDQSSIARISDLREGLAKILNEYQAQMPEGGYAENPESNTSLFDLEASQSAESEDDTQRKSQSPRTERAGGNPVDDQFYDARSHDLLLEEAQAHENAVGETQALADALDRNNRSLRDDTKEAIRFRAMNRVSKKMLEPNTSENEQIALARELQRISDVGNPITRETAQALSSRQLYQRDQRVAATVQHMDEVSKRQDNAIGDDGKGVVEDAQKKLNNAEREVANAVADRAKAKASEMDASATLWEEYRADAANRMVELLNDRDKLPSDKAAVAEFTDRVIAEMRNRIEPLLPERPESEKRELSPMEIMSEAVRNADKYHDVFETVRAQFVEEYGEGSAPVDMIDMELANMGERPYSDTNLTKAINEAIDAMSLKASELARQHVSKTNRTASALAAGLVAEAGLSESEAKYLAEDLDKTARKLIQEAREKALKDIKIKYARSTQRAKKVADSLSKITNLNNLGALTRADMMEAVAKELKLPTVKPDQLRKIAELADKVETAPNGLARTRAEYDLMNEMRIIKGITAADVGLSVWFSNMLSGFTTQLANAQGNSILSTLQLMTLMATNPKNAGNALSGWIDGIHDGLLHAKDIMKTGRSLREMGEAKTGEMGNVLETVDYARDFERLPAAIANGLQKHAAVMKYVSRAMRAADAVFFYPAREGYARVATAKILEGQYSGKELHQKIRESLGIAPDQFIKWEKQATLEGWTGMDKALRVSHLIEGHRNSTEQGRAIEQASEQYGRESTLNQDPVGLAGIVYRIARDASMKMPALRLFLPFLRIPTNLFNTSLNFTPVGALRAKFGVKDATGKGTQQFTEEEAARMYFQAIGGSVAMTALAALALAGYDDDKDPWFSITAKGTGNWGRNQQLEQNGWRAFTLKFGDIYWSYKDSPLLLPLAAIGQVVDAKRFQKTKDTLAGKNPYINAMLKLPQTIFETSMLSGLGTLMDIAGGDTSPAKIEGFIANSATSAVVPNLFKQVDRLVSPERRASDGIAGVVGQSIPGLRETGTIQSDVLGEDINTSPFDRFASFDKGDPLRDVLQSKNVFISTPSRSTKLGNEPMDEETYREYVRLSGERIRARLEPMAGLFSRQSSEAVESMVNRIVDQERNVTKGLLRAKGLRQAPTVFNPFRR